MLIKNNLKQDFSKTLTKKIFSENSYQKYYIRKNIIDNNNELHNYKKNKYLGFSVFSSIYVYSHIYNNKFTFKSFLNKKNLSSQHHLCNFYNTLVSLKYKKKFFYLLKPVKGGFLSYFSGHTGFVPANNIFFFVQKLLSKTKNKIFFMSHFIIVSFSQIKKNLRIFLTHIKLKPVSYYKRKNFSKSSVRKKGFDGLRLKSVFLLKKPQQTL